MRYGTRIFLENLQENAGWHYNLITFPEHDVDHLTEAQVEENLGVKLPDGRTFREIFWPETMQKQENFYLDNHERESNQPQMQETRLSHGGSLDKNKILKPMKKANIIVEAILSNAEDKD